MPIGTNDAYAAKVSARAEAVEFDESAEMDGTVRNADTISEARCQRGLLRGGRRLCRRFPHYQLRLDRDFGGILFLSLNSLQKTLGRNLSHPV